MRHYEMMAVIDADLDSDSDEAAVKKIESLITKNHGKIEKIDQLGKRRLAYEINHKREGNYRVLYFNGDPSTINEIDRVMDITDEVLRFGIFRMPEKR
ncbi:MAG TPA: 30S ribosomal protein S6 [Actinobacteria bacterium]|nr:30S ribosomal protein S6 [Actinomycetes bacterium]HEX21701.1 30S ribosomal protein S6 [Actinomycetota bacterium]